MTWNVFNKDLWDPNKTIRDNAIALNLPYYKALTYCKQHRLKYVILHQSKTPLKPINKESNFSGEGAD